MSAPDKPWIVSYDDAPEIRRLYAGAAMIEYGIRYRARRRYQGRFATRRV